MPQYAEQFNMTSSQYLNTGVNSQYLVPGFIHKVMLVPKDTMITQTQSQSMYATAQAGIANNTDSSRWFPIGNFTAMEDKSSKAVVNTTSIGSFVFIRDGKYHIEFTYMRGGVQLHNKLRKKFHLQQDSWEMLIVDKDTNCFMGTKPALNSSGYVTKGYTLEQIYVEQYDFNNATDEAKFRIGFVFADVDEFNERISIIQVPDSQPLMLLNGLKDLEFQTFPAPYQVLTAAVAKLRVTTGGGATDLYTLYGSALVAITAQFSFRDASGNALTCTITLDATTQTLIFTFSGAAYTALASGAIIDCFSPTITQLIAGSIPGYANTSFQLTK